MKKNFNTIISMVALSATLGCATRHPSYEKQFAHDGERLVNDPNSSVYLRETRTPKDYAVNGRIEHWTPTGAHVTKTLNNNVLVTEVQSGFNTGFPQDVATVRAIPQETAPVKVVPQETTVWKYIPEQQTVWKKVPEQKIIYTAVPQEQPTYTTEPAITKYEMAPTPVKTVVLERAQMPVNIANVPVVDINYVQPQVKVKRTKTYYKKVIQQNNQNQY